MSLSFTEKRDLQKFVENRLVDLERPGLNFSEKRAAQKELEEALNKLEGKTAASVSSLLDDLLAGKFDQSPPLKFLAVLQQIVTDLKGDVETVIEPAVNYVLRQSQAA